ncbi:hypothetical protein [Nesterenkonia sandarakina]|uniref:Riboflavin transporter FmnP n=1 Tax=Nesterenkonia sandarakina TaxID=272918 RepID=A0A7Z0E9W7_9MICC|nr:hypothetical protein [Nesterenkonia sandarakina]NYJ17596.1 riboflavin transporter FmnP [Nesterenkonia sandarakina]
MLMPLMVGMPVFAVDVAALWSLLGYLIHGLVLGLTAVVVLNRAR